MEVALKLLVWAGRKIGVAALLVLVALGGWMLYLFLADQARKEDEREARVAALAAERDRLDTLIAETSGKLAELREELARQEDRARRYESIIANLQALQDWWNRLFNREQYELNQRRLAEAEASRARTLERVAALRAAVAQALGDEAALAAARAETDAEIERVEEETAFYRYLRRAWQRAQWAIALLLVGYFFGPPLLKVVLYYGVGRWLAHSRPILLRESMPVQPAVDASGVSLHAEVWPGEAAWIKEEFLQASDEGLARRTRFLFDWRIPFTSLACGLYELIELRHIEAGGPRVVTFSDQRNPHHELALVRVPEGASLVLRPSFLAGIVKPHDQPLVIRRHWRIFTWQAWLTWQFRFFEFHGPVKLAVVGSRGVRAERLGGRPAAINESRARRTNQDATIGFSPNLRYRPVRAETFWAYFRGMNPLFDDLFEGEGVFLCQEIPTVGGAASAGRFWATLRDAVLRVFGL